MRSERREERRTGGAKDSLSEGWLERGDRRISPTTIANNPPLVVSLLTTPAPRPARSSPCPLFASLIAVSPPSPKRASPSNAPPHRSPSQESKKRSPSGVLRSLSPMNKIGLQKSPTHLRNLLLKSKHRRGHLVDVAGFIISPTGGGERPRERERAGRGWKRGGGIDTTRHLPNLA